MRRILAGVLHEVSPVTRCRMNWTFTFLILALFAGVLGFSRWAGGAAFIAQILTYLFMMLSMVFLISQELHRKDL